ncbi:energy transducer TonB [Mucilaginibacter sp. Mucisp84]|uniref:energy transducer TonB n=1 Tax=Mucilaginibacter sp. Mucisp84 TaxID=3243058 RepID=UPI0039A69300
MKTIFVIISLSFWPILVKAQTETSKIDTEEYKSSCGIKVDKQAEFPGGTNNFFIFVRKNLRWPVKSQDIEGRVIVEATITRNGKLTDAIVKRGLSKEQDREALRLINKSPKWEPAMLNGKAIDSKYYIIISFKRDIE